MQLIIAEVGSLDDYFLAAWQRIYQEDEEAVRERLN